ncbi:MAG TPA: response regulator [Lachnospiraceae bacterium]|nr:response regulator [Lachnospiraceae bacterium]
MKEKLILIADDAAFMRKLIRSTLLTAGYTNVIEACNGLEAVKLFASENPDLVLLDVTMPELDGLEALKRIVAISPEAKVIMCSAIGQDGMIMDAIRSGASEFIVKPFKKEQLIDVVTNLLG